MKIKNKIKIIVFLAVLSISQQAYAGMWDEWEDWDIWDEATSTTIINEINVSTNTGGNTATSGNITTGDKEASVEIKNIINGKEVKSVEIKTKTATSVEIYQDIEEPEISLWEEIKSFFDSLFDLW